ncbi:hypothetical protein BDQ12DRAFT_656472 [Crucibulum laeve]|uniref:F-box domain-containing protein n=1 Tax=Crucibulum laeve TaxID=68775 RepID=A0A5C3LNZ2_9AGAR|nr:hypothetical protein BDQ12DRAFT_656472 [Crucibulum laeve]
MIGLLDLPREIIEDILLNCDPLEVAKFAQTSRQLQLFVYGAEDSTLWRGLYLSQPFDDPRRCVSQLGVPRGEVDWKSELQRIIRAREVALNNFDSCQREERSTVLKTFLHMVSYVPPLSSPTSGPEISLNLLWVAAILRRGFLDEAETKWDMSPEEKQIHARLHAYYGLTQADITKASRTRSRSYVYDLRNYTWSNEFGPFNNEGNVNWFHVQAIHHVVSMHVVLLQEDTPFEYAIFPMSLPFTQIVIPKEIEPNVENDWAGITGVWSVSFCFCDHRELIAYNQSEVDDTGALDASLFDGPDFHEVFRTLSVDLKLSRTEAGHGEDSKWPTLFFHGQMRDPSHSTMNGRVSMTPDNQIQWHFVSGDQGNAVWSSEGIQVGGRRSSYGVLGSWTTIFHDDDDPVGPFWLRKAAH